MVSDKKFKIVIIDDSMLVRTIIADQLKKDPDIDVIATGKTGVDCLDLAEKYKPDAMILDIEMPIMDGLTALEEMKKRNLRIPVIVLSVLAQHGAEPTFRALELGAIDFVPKPSGELKFDPEEIGNLLVGKIKGYLKTAKTSQKTEKIIQNKTFQKTAVVKAIGIGTSTGGPKALQAVFREWKTGLNVPVFVVQHMPAGFTKAFADRLNELSSIPVKEAEDGETVKPDHAYVAPGDFHMIIEKKGQDHFIRLEKEGLVNGHRPSVEVTLESLRKAYGNQLIGVIMTGMGRDGSQKIKEIHSAGGITIAQDAESSVVYGMNRVAVEMDGVDYIEPLGKIAPKINELITQRGKN